MDGDFLRYYNLELQHLREMGAEFAEAFPKIAGRLGLESFECSDPYVERLLEGFAFLSARVHQQLDAEFPEFAQQILSVVAPHLLTAIPSCTVVQFEPNTAEGSLNEGFALPRGTALHSLLAPNEQTACEYRTAQEVTLWPIEIAAADYLGSPASLAAARLGDVGRAKAGIRLRLRCLGEQSFGGLPIDSLRLFLRGADDLASRLYAHIFGRACGVAVVPPGQSEAAAIHLPAEAVRDTATHPQNALIPLRDVSFDGYRLLMEYFIFPQRFEFVELTGLRAALQHCSGREAEIVILVDDGDPLIENRVEAKNFALNCTPAVNIFPRRADRVQLDARRSEQHLVVDRTRPLDFEVYQVNKVEGLRAGLERVTRFNPLYDIADRRDGDDGAFYTQHRRPRQASERQGVRGARSNYLGSEVFLQVVDADHAPHGKQVTELSVECLCTNRDLPLHMPIGRGETDFTLTVGAPVLSTRCLAGPTRPRPPLVFAQSVWPVLSHLSLNYLSLCDSSAVEGAAALRELLKIYAERSDPVSRKQIDGVRSVQTQPVVRRLPGGGVASVVRGSEIKLTCDPSAFEGSGMFLFGRIMEAFFARYVTINSFTETVLASSEHGEVHRWPPRIGRRHLI